MRVAACFYALGIPAGIVNVVASEQVRAHTDLANVILLDLTLVAVGAVTWFAPWARWPRWTQLSVLVVGSVITVATDHVYGYSAAQAPVDGTMVYVVFSTLWIGFTQRRRIASTVVPIAALPVLISDAARNGTASVMPALGLLAMSIVAAECLAFSRERELSLVRQLRNVVSLSRHFDMTVRRELLLTHIAEMVEHGLGASDVSVAVACANDGHATDASSGARWSSAPKRRIDVLVTAQHHPAFRVRAALSDVIPVKAIGSFELLVEEIIARLVEQHHEVTSRLRTDPLTQLGNRIAADEALDRLAPGDALVLIDVDHFKNINDTFGHASGDAILQHVAGFLRAQLRSTDDVCRFGGDELLIVLRESAESELAARVILQRWQAQQPPVTLSAGLAVCRTGERGRATLARADEALYAAKNGGRDRLAVGSDAHDSAPRG